MINNRKKYRASSQKKKSRLSHNKKIREKNSAMRRQKHFSKRINSLHKIRKRFGISRDTKIIFANDKKDKVELSFGKVAVLNSKGTELVLSVVFHHLESTPKESTNDYTQVPSSFANLPSSIPQYQPEHRQTQLTNYSFEPNSLNTESISNKIHKNQVPSSFSSDPPASIPQDHPQNKQNRLTSSASDENGLNWELISKNLHNMFPIIYKHALARQEVKSNGSIISLPPGQRQGKMYAIGYRSEALVGKHQLPGKFIGKFFSSLHLL